jgi:hypothetical protein
VSCHFFVFASRLAAILPLALMTPALADGVPKGESPERGIVLPKAPHAPVVIDSAYADVLNGPNGEHDAQTYACVRYRNVGSESIVVVRFRRTYLDTHLRPLGSDSIEDHKTRKPDPNNLPGEGPLASAYWDCVYRSNPYGHEVWMFIVRPVFVKFSSGKTWQSR